MSDYEVPRSEPQHASLPPGLVSGIVIIGALIDGMLFVTRAVVMVLADPPARGWDWPGLATVLVTTGVWVICMLGGYRRWPVLRVALLLGLGFALTIALIAVVPIP